MKQKTVEGIIKTLEPKILAGHCLTMSFADNQTYRLWNTFMPRVKEIPGRIGEELFNLQLYPDNFFKPFEPAAPFEKWAAVEVVNADNLPNGLRPFYLTGGLYAVFQYKGSGEDAPEVYRKILLEWIPANGFEIDSRPHFEVMGRKYQRGNPESEEEIWIPVRLAK